MPYLPGGMYDIDNAEVAEHLKNVPPDNASSERVFGKFDRYQRQKPNAKKAHLNAQITYTTNNCSERIKSDLQKVGFYDDFIMKQTRKSRKRKIKEKEEEANKIRKLSCQDSLPGIYLFIYF